MTTDSRDKDNKSNMDQLPEWPKREGAGLLLVLIIVVGYWLVFSSQIFSGFITWIVVWLSDPGSVFSAILTGALVYLYARQRNVLEEQAETQENQERLMEQQFTPYLIGEVAFLNITSVQFLIQNAGNGPAFNVEAEWEVAGKTRTWEVPSLPPDEEYGFPVIVDGDNWLLSTGEIQEYLDDNNASSVIDYKITCKNRFDEERKFTGSVDFGVLISRSESDEIWDDEPLDEISSELSKIQRDIQKIRGYEQNNDRASEWKNRIQQTEAIYRLVKEHGELTIDELNSLSRINERNIEFRLKALDSVGALYYNENTKTAGPIEESQETTLGDF